MPAIGVNTGHMADRVCDVLKVCRDEWISAKEVAQALGYRKPDYARKMLNVMAARGVLDTRKTKARDHTHGPHAIEYRVSQWWRNDV